MPHPNILALDLATTTGWAIGRPGEAMESGSVRFKHPGMPQEVAFANYSIWLRDMLNRGVDEVVFESPMDPRHMVDKKTRKPTTNFATIRLLLGLCAITEAESKIAGISPTECSVHDVRRCVLSGGRAPAGQAKTHVARMVQILGHRPADDNESDAIAIHIFASQVLAPGANIATPLPLGPGRG